MFVKFFHFLFTEYSQFIPAGNEPSGCLQTFGDCREGQIPSSPTTGSLIPVSNEPSRCVCGGVFDAQKVCVIPSLCLRGIHKLDMRKAPEVPGHKFRAEME